MARDVDVDVNVHDKSKPGLDSVEKRFRESGKKITKDYEKFGTGAGDAILKAVGAVSPKLAKSLAAGIGDSASLGAPLLIAGIAGAAPVIAGLVGAAIQGGAGGAGILGGVALAARDPRVKEAGTTLGQNLLANLSTQAGSFIQPVLASIDLIGERFTRNGETIERIFANSAKFVVPLTDSLLDFTDSLISGLDKAIGRAGPVFDGLDEGVEALGKSLESFLDDLSSNAEFNGKVLEETLKTVAFTVEGTGRSLKFLGDAFSAIDKVIPINPLGKFLTALDSVSIKSSALSAATGSLSRTTNQASTSIETAEADLKLYERALQDNAKAAEAAAGAQRSLFDDVTRVGEATDRAREAARKNGATLSANTKAGRANRAALSDLANAFNGYRSNLEKSGASAGKVNGTLNAQRNRLISVANSMGVTGQKARDLANRLLGIPTSRTTKVTVNTAAAASNARNIREEIARIPSSKTVNVNVIANTARLDAVQRRLDRISGGNLAAGDAFGQATGNITSRTGGASPVNIESNVSVTLDGQPLRLISARIDNRIRRDAFRNKVGRRA